MAKQIALQFYGRVGYYDNSARLWSAILNEAISKYDEIDIHLHTPGGEVFEGNLIYNIINNSDKVNVIVDGIAASMGSILLQGGTVRKIARNGYIMIHAPSGYTSGNARQHLENAKLLRSMERSAVDIFNRTNADKKKIEGWMDGNDYWFSAEEALALGLVDEIIEPVSRKIDKPDAVSSMNVDAVYAHYATALMLNFNPKKETEMDKLQMILRFGLAGLTAESSDTAIMDAIDARLEAERKARIAAENLLKEQSKAGIKALIDKAVKNGLPESNRAMFEKIGEHAGFEALEASLQPYSQPRKTITGMISGKETTPQLDKKDWKWYEANKPEELESMEDDDWDLYAALYEYEFGVKPSKK